MPVGAKILAIESSCDETACAVVEGLQVRASVVATQVAIHAVYGGVVPELASRHHLTAAVPVLRAALNASGLQLHELDGLAVTEGPGLVGALLVGVQLAQGLALATGLPLYGIHHMEGHLLSPFLGDHELTPVQVDILETIVANPGQRMNELAQALGVDASTVSRTTMPLVELGHLRRRTAWALFALMCFAVVLTASRTGVLGVGLLALWGALDRRLSPPVRRMLWSAPLLYLLAWLALSAWAASSHHAFGGGTRLAEADLSSSRFGIWANTWRLIAQQPWAGVGFGEFNLAWTLTPFPGRPVAFFDHTHNLPLQLAVELGLPLAALILRMLAKAPGERPSMMEVTRALEELGFFSTQVRHLGVFKAHPYRSTAPGRG